MSQENVETLRLMSEAWNREDFDGLLRYLDPEVEIRSGLVPPGEETRFLGHRGMRKWIQNVTDAWISVRVEPQERIEIVSDRILAIDRWLFRGREGIQIEEQLPTAFTFRNGLVIRIDGFTDKAEALEAGGLSE